MSQWSLGNPWNTFAAPAWPQASGVIYSPLQLVVPPAGSPVSVAELKQHVRVDPDITEDDDLIAGLLDAATDYCERNVEGGTQFVTATYDCPVTTFWLGPLRCLRPPLQQVISIGYYDVNGSWQTLATSVYEVRTFQRQAGTIELVPYQWWPAVQPWRRWPITIRIQCGYGPVTTIPAGVPAPGAQTVTPASMNGILVGTFLAIDLGQAREIVQVTAVTSTTFTATFAAAHGVDVPVGPNLPQTARQAIKMLAGHWYENREAVSPGQQGSVPMGVDALLSCLSYGGYR